MKTLLANVITPWLHGITVRFCRLITLQLCRQAMAVVLVAGAILITGCGGNKTKTVGDTAYLKWIDYPNSVRSTFVHKACHSREVISEDVYWGLADHKRKISTHPSWKGTKHGYLYSTCGSGGRGIVIDHTIVQLDEDVISITAESKKAEWLDKYTLLVVAEKGKSLGFKYAVFAATENRDESETTPLETTTTTSGLDVSNYLRSLPGYYPSLAIGAANSSSTTTTTGGETTTTYKRAHTVKYSSEKLPNSLNLAIIAKSIKGDDEWVIDL